LDSFSYSFSDLKYRNFSIKYFHKQRKKYFSTYPSKRRRFVMSEYLYLRIFEGD